MMDGQDNRLLLEHYLAGLLDAEQEYALRHEDVVIDMPQAGERMQVRWILLARGIWITLVILTLAIFFANLPVYVERLQTDCDGAACEYQQLTPGQVETLKGMGLSPGDYSAYTVELTLTIMVVCLAVSALIVW